MSSGRIEVTPDPGFPAGHALIRLRGAAQAAANPTFRLSRGDGWERPTLGPDGWQVADADLRPGTVATEGGDLVLGIGPDVCNHLEAGNYELSVPAIALRGSVVWPEIAPLHGGTTRFFRGRPKNGPDATGAGADGGKPRRHAGPLQGAPIVAPPPPPVARLHGTLWIGLAGLAVLILAAGGYLLAEHYRAHPPAPSPPAAAPPPQAVTPPPAPPAPPPAPPPPAVQAGPSPDTLSVNQVIARNDPAEMVAQADRRMAAHPDETLLLLETAADDHHFAAAETRMARLYDPDLPRQGGIAADPRQAARYYAEAVRNGATDVGADREKLRQHLADQQAHGDLSAKIALQEFWQ